MLNFYERVLQNPNYYRQFTCDESLITVFSCPMEARLMQSRIADLWTDHNYLFYVLDGRKIWHTAQGTFDMQPGHCVFVRKGGFRLEQIADTGFCVVLFFIPDRFICDTLKKKSNPLPEIRGKYNPLIMLDKTETLTSFFHSMYSYFVETAEPDPALLELKFRELILNISNNSQNTELLSYFCSLLSGSASSTLNRVMEDNFCFNLSLEQFARLCNQSLSVYKREFQKVYQTTPGKWLLERRLKHAQRLLTNEKKTIAEAATESGFENISHFSRAFKKRFDISPSRVHQPVLVAEDVKRGA